MFEFMEGSVAKRVGETCNRASREGYVGRRR